jgi:hypothetical protein
MVSASTAAALRNDISSLQLRTDEFSASISALDQKLTDMRDLVEKTASRTAFIENILSSPLFDASQSASLVDLSGIDTDSLSVNSATISGTLTVLDRTILSDVGVTGVLTAGLMHFDGLASSINTVGEPLRLQTHGLFGLDILNGKVTIAANGDIETLGKVIAKEVEAEKLRTNKVEITTDEPIFVGDQEVEAASLSALPSASVGVVTIPAGQTQIQVKSSALSKESLIFATPNRPVPVGTERIDSTTFVIKLKTPETAPLKVNWWIVN